MERIIEIGDWDVYLDNDGGELFITVSRLDKSPLACEDNPYADDNDWGARIYVDDDNPESEEEEEIV